MSSFSKKNVLITGAATGIGRATALAFAREGANVAVADMDDNAQSTVKEIQDIGRQAIFIKTDVSDPEQVEQMVRKSVAELGGIDIAFNNAGIGGDMAPSADYSLDSWQKVIDVNLNGVFYAMKYELNEMMQNNGGAIVNMSSILGQVGFQGAPAYVAAKHAVVGLTKTAAVEYAPWNIRINSVGPAFIKTPLIAALENDPESYQKLVSLHPQGRLGEVDEVAELVLWLASDKASFVTGSYYPVDGGYLAQ